MKKSRVKILLIENNPDDIVMIDGLVQEINRNSFYSHEFVIIPAMSISEARDYLDSDTADLILFDFYVADNVKNSKRNSVNCLFPEIPVIVMTEIVDSDIAIDSVKNGIQDFLIKGRTSADHLFRSVMYAIERHKMATFSNSIVLVDNLTGLYNEKGLHRAAAHVENLLKRRKLGLSAIYICYDKLNSIISEYDHKTGDKALKTIASILKQCFRESDLLARIGESDFVIISVDSAKWSTFAITQRLSKSFSEAREEYKLNHDLVIDFAIVHYDNSFPLNLDDLISSAKAAVKGKQNS